MFRAYLKKNVLVRTSVIYYISAFVRSKKEKPEVYIADRPIIILMTRAVTEGYVCASTYWARSTIKVRSSVFGKKKNISD